MGQAAVLLSSSVPPAGGLLYVRFATELAEVERHPERSEGLLNAAIINI